LALELNNFLALGLKHIADRGHMGKYSGAAGHQTASFGDGDCLPPDHTLSSVLTQIRMTLRETVVALGESVERLARNEFLDDLPFEFDAVGTVLAHGFYPPKAPQLRSIPACKMSTVRGAFQIGSKFESRLTLAYDVSTYFGRSTRRLTAPCPGYAA
jgi:hypothetical protein